MSKQRVNPGTMYSKIMPHSEVCMHIRVAGRRMVFTLTDRGSVQLWKRGRHYSSPILPGEAGVYQDEEGWYYERDAAEKNAEFREAYLPPAPDPGTDYGNGTVNIDEKTGIRFGVIPINDLAGDIWDYLQPANCKYTCPNCEKELDPGDIDLLPFICGCGEHLDEENVGVPPDECVVWEYSNREGLEVHTTDSEYLWVMKSPIVTHCQFCSPCMPGAGDLTSYCPTGPWTYALPEEWFQHDELGLVEERAPDYLGKTERAYVDYVSTHWEGKPFNHMGWSQLEREGYLMRRYCTGRWVPVDVETGEHLRKRGEATDSTLDQFVQERKWVEYQPQTQEEKEGA